MISSVEGTSSQTGGWRGSSDGVTPARAIINEPLARRLLGLAAGFALAAVVAQVLVGLLYGISPIDPVAWGAATLVLLAVAALANVMPAYRAMQVDPSSALRAE